MPGESAEDMLGRIRAALGGRTGEAPIPPALDAGLIRTTGAAQLIETFTQRATAAGARVRPVSMAELPEVLASLLRGCRAASLGFADDELRAVARAALVAAEVSDSGAGSDRDAHFESEIGLTDVEAAIAESGTLVYVCSAERPRAACFVPPVHVALVRKERVVADLVDYLAERPLPVPSSELLITGPSKTADIEGVLIQGVHGPGEVHILLVKE